MTPYTQQHHVLAREALEKFIEWANSPERNPDPETNLKLEDFYGDGDIVQIRFARDVVEVLHRHSYIEVFVDNGDEGGGCMLYIHADSNHLVVVIHEFDTYYNCVYIRENL